MLFIFFIFDQANLVQKIKLVSLRWNLILRLIRLCRIQCVHFFRFRVEIPFLNKFGIKNQNFQFKMKLDTDTNSNMQNSMVVFNFFIFDRKYLFWANLVQETKVITLSWNLVADLIRLCRIQWCCSLFSFSTGKALFGRILSKMSKLSV